MKIIRDRQIQQNVFSVILPNIKAFLTNSPKVHRLLLSIAESNLVLSANGSSEQISYNTIRSVAIGKIFWGANLYLSLADDGLKQIRFLPKKRLIEFEQQLVAAVKVQLYKDLKKLVTDTQSAICERVNNEPLSQFIDKIYHELEAALASKKYFKTALKNNFKQILSAYIDFFAVNRILSGIDQSIAMKLDYLENVFNELDLLVEKHYRRYNALRLESNQAFFDTVESHPLTDEQRYASIMNDSRNLVVASAGSGKTSVIVAKVGSMIRNGDVRADEILVLSFAKDSVKEIKDRIRKNLVRKFGMSKNIVKSTMTFHSLGLKILQSVAQRQGDKVPEVYTKSEQDNIDYIYKDLINLLRDDKKKHKLIEYLVHYLKPAKPEIDFKTKKEFALYKRDNGFISFKGDKVKSSEEFTIANFLFMYGVEYSYEKEYDINHSDGDCKKYQPDFTITCANGRIIYLEHFGVDEKNIEPPSFSTPKEFYGNGIYTRKTERFWLKASALGKGKVS